MEVGKREIMYLSLHCHHQNDSCIKMGSDELLIVRDKVTRPQLLKTKRAEADSNRGPSAYQPNALPLGHTGSRSSSKAGWRKDVVNQCLALPGVWTHSNRLFLTPVSLKGDYCNPLCAVRGGEVTPPPLSH